MPRGGPRGNKKSHKGQRRHFTSEDELKAQVERQEKEKEWRRKKGIESDEEEEVEDGAAAKDKKKDGEDVQSGEGSSESESDSESEETKIKGVQHLIAIENPNHVQKKTKKVTSLTLENDDSKPVLTRREKEELQKQQARAHYQKLHLEGKTEEARADMARLALIRKNREDAARRREEEKKAADEKKKIAEQRLLERKAQQQQKK